MEWRNFWSICHLLTIAGSKFGMKMCASYWRKYLHLSSIALLSYFPILGQRNVIINAVSLHALLWILYCPFLKKGLSYISQATMCLMWNTFKTCFIPILILFFAKVLSLQTR